MRNLFSSFDNDRDGRIFQPEFLKMLSSLGYTISHEEVTQMLNAFDQNGDKEMDFLEFMNMVNYLKEKVISMERELWKIGSEKLSGIEIPGHLKSLDINYIVSTSC